MSAYLDLDDVAAQSPLAQQELASLRGWRDAIDSALVAHGLDCLGLESPTQALNSLLAHAITIALDPAVSAEAQALIDRGAEEERVRLSARIAELEPVAADAERWAAQANRCDDMADTIADQASAIRTLQARLAAAEEWRAWIEAGQQPETAESVQESAIAEHASMRIPGER